MRLAVTNARNPMLPTGSGSSIGLLEKRLLAVSSLGLDQSVSYLGDWLRYASDYMLLDNDADWHNNHANDPATHTLSVLDVATFAMDRARSIESEMNLTDYAHASLDGYHPPVTGNGTGDPDLSKHEVTANETVLVGQPVYVSGNNTVNLADASSVNTADAIGLVLIGATVNETATILTEGSVNQADWTSVIGSASLSPGSLYFLDTTVGKMSVTAPNVDGQVVVKLGTAITTTKFDIEVNKVAIL